MTYVLMDNFCPCLLIFVFEILFILLYIFYIFVQLAFTPRSVATNNPNKSKKLDLVKFVKPGGQAVKPGSGKAVKPAGDSSNGSDSNGSAAPKEEAAKEEAAPAKSNDDFRKMLLGSK